MSRKHKKKHRTIVLGGWGSGFPNDYDAWDTLGDEYDDSYFCGYSRTTTTKSEKVVPDFKICPTKSLEK